MEKLLSLFIFHDAYVVSFLVAAIMIITIILLTFNFKSPESVVMNEVNSSENIEGALRRVLGENNWVGAGDSDGTDSAEAVKKIGVLENEVLTKDKEIADLHKQLTQGSKNSEGDAGGDNSDLMEKIDELEARLQEYEIIEDDIADLSLYKAENEKLKAQLSGLKSSANLETPPVEVSQEDTVEEIPEAEPVAISELDAEDESDEEVGRDLVAEFEKVVNNKDAIVGDDPMSGDTDDGNISVKAEPKTEAMEVVHPKLKDIKPDSKEEADVLIADLKSIKKGS